MALWKRFWLLGTVVWAVVCVLNAATILAFSEGEAAKAVQPLALALAVPALAIHDCKPGWPRWTAISLMLVGPLLFFVPILLQGLGPSSLRPWLPGRGLTGTTYHLAIFIGLFVVCSALEDVEPAS